MFNQNRNNLKLVDPFAKNRNSSINDDKYLLSVCEKPASPYEQMASTVGDLANNVIREISNPSDVKVEEMRLAVLKDPTILASANLLIMRGSILMGQYYNSDKKIEQELRENFKNINSTLGKGLRALLSSVLYGFACLEPTFKTTEGRTKLRSLVPLKPDKVVFKGHGGEITHVKYYEGGEIKYIPYWKIIHSVRDTADPNGSPYGMPLLRSVWPFYKAKTSLIQDLIVAGKVSATGILWGRVDGTESVQQTDSYGKPILGPGGFPIKKSSAAVLQEKLMALDNRSVLVTDNAVQIQRLPADGSTFNYVNSIEFLDKLIKRGMLGLDLAFSSDNIQSGITATLVQKTYSALDNVLYGILDIIKDELIEKVAKPLIVANYGSNIKDFGSWTYDPEVDLNMQLQIASGLSSAMGMGIIPMDDVDAVNAVRKAYNLSPLSKEETETMKATKLQQQQAMEQQTQVDDPNAMTYP